MLGDKPDTRREFAEAYAEACGRAVLIFTDVDELAQYLIAKQEAAEKEILKEPVCQKAS